MSLERDLPRAVRPKPAREESLEAQFLRVRATTERLAAPLSAEDALAQSMPDASPVKWHLAHTTWFIEQVLLRPRSDWTPFEPRWDVLFNSYYETLGPRVARGARGLITRPSLDEVMAYRRAIDAAVLDGLASGGLLDAPGAGYLFELAMNHEEQHQELILMDLLHLFAQSPLDPAYADEAPRPGGRGPAEFLDFEGGLVEIGWDGEGFAFDNEGPRHAVLLQPFQLADRPVSNAEWLEFIADGGYAKPELWMSDGWAKVQAEGWQAPLYWRRHDGLWTEMTLSGRRPLDPQAAVAHVSWYEADAFARWAGARLPTEAEWEGAVCSTFNGDGLRDLYDGVWQWTSSAYGPYPGFRPTPGTTSEYNGKFMANQMVLRGGACVTPQGHSRRTYRNFFYPHQRWQFSGLRLAKDLDGRPKRRGSDSEFLAELKQGLGRPHKAVSPKWFYDDEGSRLFEEITELQEYYPTRTETKLLADVAKEIAAQIPDGAILVEFGSGASAKTRLMLDAAPQIVGYVPLDISEQALAEATARIKSAYPELEVEPVVGDFTRPLGLPSLAAGRPRVGFFPGSTIGNFSPEEARLFLRSVKALLGGDAILLIGADLVKDEETLVAAYDDAKGVTAAFNKNLLARANRELGADFDLDGFAHRAVWNAARSRMEMHLVSLKPQDVRLGSGPGAKRIHFADGESVHTENSHKFTVEGFKALAEASGWRLGRSWVSPRPEFAVFLLRS